MGAKPIFAFRFPSRSILKVLAAGALALAVSSCISDGPNRTGGEYLAQNGVLLKDPLYHVSLKNIPVDSFWTTDGEGSHLGDSTMLVGRSGDFSAEGRIAFQISDTAILYNMDITKAFTLKLSLGFPAWTSGLSALHASVATDPAHPIDSIPFEVLTWETTSLGLTDDQWTDTVNTWNRRYLNREDTLAALDTSHMIRDTIYLRYDSAYTRNTPQAKPLPNLHGRLSLARGVKHMLEMRLVRISKDSVDAPGGILRLGGFTGSTEAELVYGPLLVFGNYDSITGVPTANRLRPMLLASGKTMVNYTLKYAGPKNNIVTGKIRGLHVILDRKTLLDSIDASLRLQHLPVQPRAASGDYDAAYFVPFAKITLPLDAAHSNFEGGYPLIINMITAMDTLLGDIVAGGIRIDTVLDNTSKVLFHTYESGQPGKIHDDVSIVYADARKPGDSLRTVIVKYSVDTLKNDTLFVRVGEAKQRTTILTGYGSTRLYLDFTSQEASLLVRSYFTNKAEVENNEYRDPQTGETITDLATRLPRFLKPGQTELPLRATDGFQRLLNRTQSNASVLQDFQFQPAAFPAVDPKTLTDKDGAAVSGEDKVPVVVEYPVLSVVVPRIQGNDLKVDVDLYLYPLKAR